MSPNDGRSRHERPAETSRRGFLKRAAALGATGAIARPSSASIGRRGNSPRGSMLAYVGTYSSPQGPEGSRGNGQGIYLFQVDLSTGGL
ncbi:MAG TPA: twin-arginine translocation signal domain-containing protein, partial [Terriglobia bacterium]|nr:twin-arginine translocation signal domain-containing protein [Terriglobia bacterium]